MAELSALVVLGLLGYYWYNQTTALDLTRLAGKQITQQKGWVFLDDSVLQKKISIKPRYGKLSYYRVFEFEFSDANAKRYKGAITHHGGKVVEIKFFHEFGIETIPLQN